MKTIKSFLPFFIDFSYHLELFLISQYLNNSILKRKITTIKPYQSMDIGRVRPSALHAEGAFGSAKCFLVKHGGMTCEQDLGGLTKSLASIQMEAVGNELILYILSL